MAERDPDDAPGTGRPRAGVPRRPTADPYLFLIPEEQLPPGFAEGLDDPREPVPARAAATVVLLRDGESAPEALLLRRHRKSGFAADAWVFPGGTVDEGDRDPALAAASDGPSAEAWGHRMGISDPSVALGYPMAAIREAFEETGILLGNAAASEAELEEARRAVLAGELSLGALAARLGARYRAGDLLYLAHWITPEPEPRRYDTRFFVARVSRSAVCTPHAPELVEARWMAPAEAVERFTTGEIRMLPPTVDTLRRLSGFRTTGEVWEALQDAPVPPVLPRMRRHPNGVAIEIPRPG